MTSSPQTSTQSKPLLPGDLEQINATLSNQLAAQKQITEALEQRVAQALETIQTHLRHGVSALPLTERQHRLELMEAELHQLSTLLSDTTLLQKLTAGKVAVTLEVTDLAGLLTSISHTLQRSSKVGKLSQLQCKIAAQMPKALIDQDLTESVVTDLLARALKYSDPTVPVVLEALRVQQQIQIHVLAQRFAPIGQREDDFAPEIALCCKQVELQRGSITCQLQDGLTLVTISLPTVPHSPSISNSINT
jgi:signal transduction histidine kinase